MDRTTLTELLEQVPSRAQLVRATTAALLFEYKLLGTYYVVDLLSGTVTKGYYKAYAA